MRRDEPQAPRAGGHAQYFKLRKKVAAGARFVINQIGYDTRKDDELLRWIRREEPPVAVLANVYLLSRAAARAFHRGAIPGAIVTDELLEIAERESAGPDKGKAFFVDLAGRHIAVARGLGFSGVYVGGHMPASTFDEILDAAEGYAGDDWVALAREIQFPSPASSTSSSATPRPASRRTSSARRTSSPSAAGRPTCACR